MIITLKSKDTVAQMSTKKSNQLGVWMDPSIAYIIEFTANPFTIQNIIAEFPLEQKEEQKHLNHECLTTLKKYILLRSYYKIGQALLGFKKITLFGPTCQKLDFFDFLSENEPFLKLRIEIKDAATWSGIEHYNRIKEHAKNRA